MLLCSSLETKHEKTGFTTGELVVSKRVTRCVDAITEGGAVEGAPNLAFLALALRHKTVGPDSQHVRSLRVVISNVDVDGLSFLTEAGLRSVEAFHEENHVILGDCGKVAKVHVWIDWWLDKIPLETNNGLNEFQRFSNVRMRIFLEVLIL